jgi:ribose transport system ATP-binding protein
VDGLAAPGLREASFTLRRGEVLGVFGLMGSGRTEMVRALFGLARPTGGRVACRARAPALDERPPPARPTASAT